MKHDLFRYYGAGTSSGPAEVSADKNIAGTTENTEKKTVENKIPEIKNPQPSGK